MGVKIYPMMKQEWNKKILWVLAFAILFFIGAVAFYWFSSNAHHSMKSPNKNQYHAQHLKPPEHGEVNMPGLQGEGITEKEINDLKTLFTQHEKITHTVEILPNGVKTLTETANEQLRENLFDDVAMMVTHLQEEKSINYQ